MDRLRRIELMICAAQAGSFTQAARLLQLDPSAFSHAIAELEKDLGFRLFYRTTRQLTLTEEGENVMRHGQAMLREMAEIQGLASGARQRLKGTLRIGMSVSLSHHVVMPRITDFMRCHPDVRLECLILNQAKDIHSAGLDILFQSGNAVDSELVSRKIVTLRLGVYAAPAYLEWAGEPETPEALLQHACLVHKPSFTTKGWSDWEFQQGAERLSVKVPASLMTDDREGLIAAALGGAGIMRIGMFNPALLASGQLRKLLPGWDCLGGPTINVLFRKSSRNNPRVAAFLDFIDEVFTALDPEELTLQHHPKSMAG